MASRFASKVKSSLRSLVSSESAKILVAVSGGADSISLLWALAEGGHGKRLCVAHIEHNLREKTEQEADFVAKEAESVGASFVKSSIDTKQIAKERGKGIEEAARVGRYQELIRIATEQNISYIATGHTKNDQAETVFWRLLRGGALGSLSAIPTKREIAPSLWLLRPLLSCSKAECLAYIKGLGRFFIEDPSNTSREMTRNRIRNEILPFLEKENPEFSHSLAQLATEADGWRRCLASIVEEKLQTKTQQIRGGVALSVRGFLEEPAVLQEEMIRFLWKQKTEVYPSKGQVESIIRLLHSDGSSAISLRGGNTAIRSKNQILLHWNPSNPAYPGEEM